MPREPVTVSVVVITNRGGSALEEALRSVVEQDYRPLELVLFANGASVDGPDVGDDGQLTLVTGGADRNLGVAGGRNAATRLASGELILFLDDDATLRPGSIKSAVEVIRSSPRVGAVAFRIVEPETGDTIVWLYPQDMNEFADRQFDAPWVLGGAHLIRRDLFERLRGFWEGFFREMEEIDLSWRLLDADRTIRYDPHAAIEHPLPPRRSYRYAVPSHLTMIWRLLPIPLALRQSVVMLALFTGRAVYQRELGDLARGVRAAVPGIRRGLRERAVLSGATIDYLRSMHAQGRFGQRLSWSLRRRA